MSLATLEPYDRTRVRTTGGEAVVLGASVAGLLTARVLADAFDRVTVVDRDPQVDEVGPRRGVPQGRHLHVLLRAGQVIMEQLFPRLADELVASGAVELDLSRDVRVHAADGFLAAGAGDMPLYYASRPLIERRLRDRVAEHRGVALWSDCHVAGDPVVDADGGVGGVVVLEDGRRREVRADLVVDATGRRSRATTWLDRLGFPVPATEEVHVDLAYRTCQVQRPPRDRRAMLILPSPPRTRGAAVAPVEGDRWLVTLFGVHGDHPPRDLEGLRRFAGALPTRAVRELLDDHGLVVPEIAHYRFPSSIRRRYDRLGQHPRGLLSLGDAIASFNPIYGQGMSVAALQALALHQSLADGGPHDLAARFYARAGRVVDDVWGVAAGGDFQFAQTEGAKPPGVDLLNRYVTRLHRRAHTDGRLADAFSRVATLERSPTSLLRPSVAWRVLRPWGGPRRRRATGDR